MNNRILNKEKKCVSLITRLTQILMQKKWKGGRLKKRLNNARAYINGQLTISVKNVIRHLKTSWLSSEDFHQRFPRGKENTLICLSLLIDKRNN